MLIQKTSIQNLIDSISLSEHIRKYIELKRSGSNWLGLCPFHQDSTPSFYVYPNNYHCFACNAHGNVLDYEIHRTGLSFKECVEQLAQTYQYKLDYESSLTEKKNDEFLQRNKQQIDILKKIQLNFNEKEFAHIFSVQELQIIKDFFFSSRHLIEAIFLYEFREKHFLLPCVKENGDIYGFSICEKNFQAEYFLTLNQNLMPCLNWNEARPYAIKEKQLIVTFNSIDANLLKQKNILNVVVCLHDIDIYLLKLFSRRIRKLLLILPEQEDSKDFLLRIFSASTLFQDISIDVLMVPQDNEKRTHFMTSLQEDKIKLLFQNCEKIHIKMIELFLNSLPKEANKLRFFQQKILPILNKIKENSLKNALLVDIAHKFFYGENLGLTAANNTFINSQYTEKAFVPAQKSTDDKSIKVEDVLQKQENSLASSSMSSNRYNSHTQELIDLMNRTVEFYHKCLFKFKTTVKSNEHPLFSYLKLRGLSEASLQRWKIGYCSPQQDLSKKAQTGIVSQENLSILGLIKKTKQGNNYYDFFHDRIIIPIYNHTGDYVALSGRTYESAPVENNNYYSPKYINSAESEIFSKSKILFNFYKAVDSIVIHKYVIVVEGYMDCISLVDAGIENVVAVMGTALTQFHLDELSKLTKRIVLCFDNDKAGQAAAKRSFASSVRFQGIDLEYFFLPDCKDPDEFIRRFGKQDFLRLLQTKNTYLYEKICEWCHKGSRDYQDFVQQIQEEFSCLNNAQNENLTKQVDNYIKEKFNISLTSFFASSTPAKPPELQNVLRTEELDLSWPVKNPLEMKLLLSLVYLKFSELPQRLQNIMLDAIGEDENDEKICAQSLQNQFSKTGLDVFLEISTWMLENPHISIAYVGIEGVEGLSNEAQILIGYALSDVKVLMRFHLHELIKDSLSSGLSMVLSENVWNLKNAGFLKFLLRNIKLASQTGVLHALFAEALINLEVDYIDDNLRMCSSLHFDNELDSQFQFLVSERVRCKIKLENLSIK